MIRHIITPSDKQRRQQKLKKLARNYNFLFVVTLVAVFCISILPFHFKWIGSADTEPREAVVCIRTSEGQGSGFLVSSEYILTARHVVEELEIGDRVDVSFAQAKIPFETTAEVYYYQPYDKSIFNKEGATNDIFDYLSYFETDVAILRLVEEVKQISPLALGDSDKLKAGNVLIMGYGLDDWSEPEGKVTSSSFHENQSLFKLDGSINKGHSGGPIMLIENNEPTKVIGIVVGDYSTVLTVLSGNLVRGENVALKINQAAEVISRGGYSLR